MVASVVQGMLIAAADAEEAVSSRGEEALRLAVPRRRYVLSTAVEVYGKPIREAVATLSESIARKDDSIIWASLLLPRCEQLSSDIVRSDAEMAAWAIVLTCPHFLYQTKLEFSAKS